MATLTVTGFKELDYKLNRMAAVDSKKAVRKSTRPALKPVQQEIKNNLPSDEGELKKSVKIRSLTRSRKRIGAKVTTNVRHASFIEFGTKHIKARGTWKRAARLKRHQSLRIYGEQIGKNIVLLAKSK